MAPLDPASVGSRPSKDAHFFARLLARVRPRRVLELACGSGRVTFTLAVALPKAEIVGVDSSIEMLAPATPCSASPVSLGPLRHNASPYPVNRL
jgi:ubiquinone/menaquinone biosynthesis C-methylase UbiE